MAKIGYDALTLEDCEYLYDKIGISVVIEDGHAVGFIHEEESDAD